MATFDQLSAEQRAIIELVLKRGQSYGQLGDTLGMPTERVKELARSALLTLSPVSAAQVEEDWRGQIADYLLGQQSGPESAVTRGHLRRSEAGRAWSRSLLDSLDQLYDPATVPTIPAGNGSPQSPTGKEKAAPERASSLDDGAAALSPEARAIVRRRRIAGAAALAVVALVAILLWPIGVLTGDDDDKSGARADQRAAPRVIGQLVLKPVKGAEGAAVAAIAQRGKRRTLIVQARVKPNKTGQAYEVWLYNSDSDARSLGAQVTDRQGTYQGAAELPRDFARFKFIDVSREKVDDASGHSGRSVLRGRIADFAAPPPVTQQTQP